MRTGIPRLSSVFLLIISTTSAWASPSAPFQIVSDLDDTAKITDTLNPLKAAKNALFSEAMFAGMSELYGELVWSSSQAGLERGVTPLTFISGSPVGLEDLLGVVSKELRDNDFPDSQLYLKHLGSGSTLRYKKEALADLTSKQNLPMVCLGDDTESDPEVYSEFQAENPAQRVERIYIHRVIQRFRAIPKDEIPYYTAFDIALVEAQDGRLSPEQAGKVGGTVLAALDDSFESVFPEFAICPVFVNKDAPKTKFFAENPSLAKLFRQIKTATDRACRIRRGIP